MEDRSTWHYLLASRKFVAAVVGTVVILGMRAVGMIDDVSGTALMVAVGAPWGIYAAAQGLADAFGGKR